MEKYKTKIHGHSERKCGREKKKHKRIQISREIEKKMMLEVLVTPSILPVCKNSTELIQLTKQTKMSFLTGDS